MASPIEPMQWLSMIASFILVLVLLGATLWLLRRMGGRTLRAGSGRLAIVESLWLGPRQRLALVKVDNQDILIAVTQQSVTLLTVLPAAAGTQPCEGSSSTLDRSPDAGEATSAPPPGGADRPGTPVQPDAAVADRFRQLLRGWSSRSTGGGGQ